MNDVNSEALLASILTDTPDPRLDSVLPFVPLSAPGMPLPGPNFLRAAQLLGDSTTQIAGKGTSAKLVGDGGKCLHYLYRRALYDNEFALSVEVKGTPIVTKLVPGHLWGDDTRDFGGGPRQASVMVIGKNPGADEIARGRNFVGPSSEEFVKGIQTLGLDLYQLRDWYLTNLVKWPQLDANSNGIPAAHVRDCAVLLAQEIKLVRPSYILCLGSDASKAMLGTASSVEAMTGRVEEYKYTTLEDGLLVERVAKVMTATHPAAVFRTPELGDAMNAQLNLFWQLAQGAKIGEAEKGVDHADIYSERALSHLVDQMLADTRPDAGWIAVDGEWHGEAPQEPGAYLRTIQISNKDKWARTIVLRRQGGAVAFRGGVEGAIRQLNRLFFTPRPADRPLRVGGHFLRADMPWLIHAGLDLRGPYAPNPDQTQTNSGGWDTSLAYHAYNETASFKLEDMATRLTSVPRYDRSLQRWKADYCAKMKWKAGDLDGYGECPAHILHPYACLHGDSLVQTEPGDWVQIKKLVKSKYAGRVFALVRGKVVLAEVTNWHRNQVNQKSWKKLVTASTPKGRHGYLGPVFTPDHKVVTKRGKVAVEDLVVGSDAIVTEEEVFSRDQLSVFLACMLGDGGFTRQNEKGRGFGFSQRESKREYLEWKAGVFQKYRPSLRRSKNNEGKYSRYETAFARYFHWLSSEYPVKDVADHGHRKLCITDKVLLSLGDLGLAVWYQDDGTFVGGRDNSHGVSSRIYCEINEDEQVRVVKWLSDKLGDGVSYNKNSEFIQITGSAFGVFHKIIRPFMCPVMGYKTPLRILKSPTTRNNGSRFCETIVDIIDVDYQKLHRRGSGVRYCLTTTAGNFLTKVGFVSNCFDADATRRCMVRLLGPNGLVFHDSNGCNSWQAYWRSHMASLAFLEMEMTGFQIDRARADQMSTRFMAAVERLTAELRQAVNWPGFNPRSQSHCCAVLFGDRFGTRKDPVTKQTIPVRPPQAVTLNLTPLKTTGKRAILWSVVVQRRQEHMHKPCADKEVLGTLGQRHPIARKLRDLKFLMQVLSSSLRSPVVNDDTGEFDVDEDGFFEYDAGLLGSVLSDGRVHTHLFQTKETGRASSARPALQNLCFDALTEVLTRRGWVMAPDVRPDDHVAQFWCDTEAIDFVQPTEVHRSHFEGDMIRLFGEQVDLLLTPHHRCLLRQRRSGNWLTVEARDWPVGKGDKRIWHAGHYAGGDVRLTWGQVAWICAVQADGSYTNGFEHGQGVSFSFTKQRKQTRLRRVLTAIGASWTEKTSDDGKVVRFYVGVTDNRELIQQTKERLGPEKCFGSWLLDYDRLTLTAFVDEVLEWDALWTRKSEYSSSIVANSDWVQILWTLSGIRARRRIYRPSNHRASDHYCVDIPQPARRRAFTGIGGTLATKQPWNDSVYCLSVPSSYLVVRRNGKVAVSGNSKRREDDYRRILTPEIHVNSVRSVLCVPSGYVGIEADLKAAEVAVTGWSAQDANMINHTERSNLPESHIDYYDIHAQMAVRAFNLSCPPTKKGLDDAGCSGFRVAAKAIIFGTPYGRGPDAISRQLAEVGTVTSVEDCRRLQDTYFDGYPRVWDFFEEAKARSQDPRWLCNAYGRHRRFQASSDRSVIGDQQRQAMNFPIQSGVADAVSIALYNLLELRDKFTPDQLDFRIMLQIHDAIILLVPIKFAGLVYHDVLPLCMEQLVDFWPASLDGTRMTNIAKPYHFGSDVEVFQNWGEKMTPERAALIGLPKELAS
jgi:uracil-DNA glycosylase family 4